MGIFDIFEDIVEKTVETVVRLPEIPVRTIKGTVEGIDKGIDKISESFDD